MLNSAFLFTLSDGKIVHCEGYPDRGEALKAVGLEEQQRRPTSTSGARSSRPGNRGDFSMADWADPDIEFVLADWPDAGTWSGVAGMAEGMRQLLSAWEDFYVMADEFRELDDERVFVLVHVGGRGKTSGLELQAANVTRRGAHGFHISDGKVTRLVIYFDRDHALADLDLEQQAVSRENLEAVRRQDAAGREGDWDTMAAIMGPHIVVRTDPRWPEQIFYGRQAVLAWFRGLQETRTPSKPWACRSEPVSEETS